MTADPWNIEALQPSAKPEWLTNEVETYLKDYHFPLNRDGLLMLWRQWEYNLKEAKELEMRLRKIATQVLVPAKTEGTTNVPLGNEYQAKVVNKYNYKLPDNDKVWSILDKIGSIGNQGKFIADRLVSWQPNFLKTEYVTLQEEAEKGSEDAKAILKVVNDELVTIEIAAPTLTIVEPKAKKK